MAPTPEQLPDIPYDFWDEYQGVLDDDDIIAVTCLLPNGIIISLNVPLAATVSEIKEVSDGACSAQ